MDIKIAKEILACLPKGKTPFNYYKDKYAVFLLSQIIEKQCAIADLKCSPYAGLLNKPLIKQIIAQSGDGLLRQEQLDMAWDKCLQPFFLTLGIWGFGHWRFTQVSRPGYSLVLQLNFGTKHDVMFKKLVDPENNHDFNRYGHPVRKKRKRQFFRETMAWARIDFDLNTKEALIEELQTDWLRTAKELFAKINAGESDFSDYGINAKTDRLKIYLESVLSTYGSFWDEALLTAALQFVRQELGITTIYLHTPETGVAVKRIKNSKPPISLYSTLPKRFCFSQTDKAPEFLYQDRKFRKLEKKLGGTQWNVINLGENYADITKTATEKPCRHVTLAA